MVVPNDVWLTNWQGGFYWTGLLFDGPGLLFLLHINFMKRYFNVNFLVVLVMLFAFSCSWYSNKKSREQSSVLTKAINQNDTSFLADKNFVYRNLTSTAKIRFFTKPMKNGVDFSAAYADSALKIKYFQLSPNQAGFLIAPFLPKGYGVDYAKEEMWAWLVAKQQKIGNFQPIIVSEVGVHDYEALQLVVLDKMGEPVDEFDLEEENPFPHNAGYPYTYHAYSLLNKNEIESYRISERTDSAKRQVIIDSNVFRSIIGTNGKIATKQIAKLQVIKSL
jgi:hypothetical protein